MSRVGSSRGWNSPGVTGQASRPRHGPFARVGLGATWGICPAPCRRSMIMVGSSKRIFLGLALLVAARTLPTTRAAEDSAPGPTAGVTADSKAGRVTSDAVFEDPPQLFVPFHPQTVEQRKQIEAITDFSAARAFENENLWL